MRKSLLVIVSLFLVFSGRGFGTEPENFSSNPYVTVEKGAESFQSWFEPMEWWFNPYVKKRHTDSRVYIRYGIPATLKVDRFSQEFDTNVVRIAPLAVKIPFALMGLILSTATLPAFIGNIEVLHVLMGAWLFENGLFQGISQPVVRTHKRKSFEHLPFKKATFPITQHLRIADILRGSPLFLPETGTKVFPQKLHLSSTYRGKIKNVAADFEIIEGPREGEVLKRNLKETKMVSPLCKTFLKAIGWDL